MGEERGGEECAKWKEGETHKCLEELLKVAVRRAVEDLEAEIDGDALDGLICMRWKRKVTANGQALVPHSGAGTLRGIVTVDAALRGCVRSVDVAHNMAE